MEVDLGGSTLSWPSQSAMTLVSTPACRSRIAAVCRSACAVIVLPRNDGHCWGAILV